MILIFQRRAFASTLADMERFVHVPRAIVMLITWLVFQADTLIYTNLENVEMLGDGNVVVEVLRKFTVISYQ